MYTDVNAPHANKTAPNHSMTSCFREYPMESVNNPVNSIMMQLAAAFAVATRIASVAGLISRWGQYQFLL
jgi:hypothetical protein